MSLLTTDTELTKIQAPGLTDSNYGSSVKEQFENIDNNFQRLSNYDFIAGKSGSGIRFCNLKLYDENKFTELGSALLNTVVKHLGVDPSGLDWNKTSEWENIEILKRVNGTNFLDYIKENPDINVMYTLIDVEQQDEDDNRTYICSPGPYTFIDNRYRNISDGGALPTSGNEYESLLDTSCMVTLTYEKINDKLQAKFQAINVFPTLYYDSYDKQFKWKVYGNESGIIAQGPQGFSSNTSIKIVAAVDDANNNRGMITKNNTNLNSVEEIKFQEIKYLLINTGQKAEWYTLSAVIGNSKLQKYLPKNGDVAIVAGITNPTDVNVVLPEDIADLSNTDMYFSYVFVKDGKYNVILNKLLGVRSNTYASALVRNLVNVGGSGDTLGCLFIPYRGSTDYSSLQGGAHTAYSIQRTGSTLTVYDLHIKPITVLGFNGGTTGTTEFPYPTSGITGSTSQPGWVNPDGADLDTAASMNIEYEKMTLLNGKLAFDLSRDKTKVEINGLDHTGTTSLTNTMSCYFPNIQLSGGLNSFCIGSTGISIKSVQQPIDIKAIPSLFDSIPHNITMDAVQGCVYIRANRGNIQDPSNQSGYVHISATGITGITGKRGSIELYTDGQITVAANQSVLTLYDGETNTQILDIKNARNQSIFTIGNHKINHKITGRVNGQDNVIIGCPIGTIVMWTGKQIPEGWVACKGQSINVRKVFQGEDFDYYDDDSGEYYRCNNSEYTKLFHIIGFKFSNKNRNNEYKAFKLPNFEDRFPYGAITGTTGKDIGVTGGTSSHKLSLNEMQHRHYIGGTGVTGGTYSAYYTTEPTPADATNIVNDMLDDDPDTRSTFNILPPYTSVLFIIKYM